MRYIKLSQGKRAKVDDDDYEYLNQWKWHAIKSRRSYYAIRFYEKSNGLKTTIRLHRVILGLINSKRFCDHKDGNGLNNQKNNLRKATIKQNSYNRRLYDNNTSGYKGVSWHKHTKKWVSRIRLNNKRKSLGYFSNKILAAKAYDKAAKKLFGKFARLNFPNHK